MPPAFVLSQDQTLRLKPIRTNQGRSPSPRIAPTGHRVQTAFRSLSCLNLRSNCVVTEMRIQPRCPRPPTGKPSTTPPPAHPFFPTDPLVQDPAAPAPQGIRPHSPSPTPKGPARNLARRPFRFSSRRQPRRRRLTRQERVAHHLPSGWSPIRLSPRFEAPPRR